MKKTIMIILALGLLIGVGTGIYLWNKPKRTAEDEKPVAVLNAEDLFVAFSTDEASANTAYLNKIVQVKGTVLSTETNEANEFTILLDTGDVGTIMCSLVPGATASVKEGDQISIKGIVTGYLMDVVLTQCALVQ